jgi:hypothetical protein
MKLKVTVVTELYSLSTPEMVYDSYEAALFEAETWFKTIGECPFYEIKIEVLDFY